MGQELKPENVICVFELLESLVLLQFVFHWFCCSSTIQRRGNQEIA
jgi:hypothetical protein